MAGKVTVGLASHWPCLADFSGLSNCGLSGVWKGDEHAAKTPVSNMAPLYLYRSSGVQW